MTGPTGLMDFAGDWSLARRIIDRHSDQTGTLSGIASFTPDGAGLTLSESGLLRLGDGPSLEANRTYLWRDGIAVFFEDGRPFHRIDLAAPQAHHACAPDSYAVAYDFSDWPRWTSTWNVTGPRKDYTMVSAYAPTSSVITFDDRSKVR